MPSVTDRVRVPYVEARDHILDGDVLLYSGRSLVSKVIQVAGITTYSHAGMAGWTNGDPASEYNRLMAYEMRWQGARGTKLSAHAKIWRNQIDVYRVSDTFTTYKWNPTLQIQEGTTHVLDRKAAVTAMRDFCEPGAYGKMHLLWTALTHVPAFRFFCRPPTDDELEDRTRPPYCSEAVAYAIRKAFSDVVRNTPDHFTEPGDLARSPLLHYMFTLV